MKAKSALARKSARVAAPKSKPAARGDRSVARRGDTTRLSILNAAERCFGENGFDGVSLRTITEVAGVDLALVNYHFGSKDNLLHEVIARRARIVHEERVRALELARHEAGARSPSVEAIVTAFLEPLLRRLVDGDAGWRHYCNLASQLDVLPKFIALTSDVLDPTALHFINALRLTLPKATPQSIYWGYMFLIGSMVQVMSATGRIERLSRGLCRSDDIEGALRELVPFVSAGLRAFGNPAK
ncbi:MAG: TetR/AcrR family transcriptional regulator [Beijerinckiaceae bacterium]|jgi:AcrR family transcriptional regulator